MENTALVPVPGFEGIYRVSCDGVVQSSLEIVRLGRYGSRRVVTDNWTTLKHSINPKGGHHRVTLYRRGRKPFCVSVHRLVLLAFGPAKPFPGAIALHKDDDPDNNHLSNLYWGTSKQNRADAMRSGRAYIPKGEENGKSILTASQVAEIKAFPRKYGYRKTLAQKFGVSVAAIKDIVSGRSWNSVPCETPSPNYDRRAPRRQ